MSLLLFKPGLRQPDFLIKSLQPILDKPMLIHQLNRIRKCKNIDKLIIATSTHISDDGLTNICHDYGYDVKRGSLTNVVQRFQTALEHEKNLVIWSG